MTGITMRYHDTRLKELGMGALLHDIGKLKIDKDL
jgi:HD-GYP domain-containing protein (c-di-GMP phosphodiesterase class II)